MVSLGTTEGEKGVARGSLNQKHVFQISSGIYQLLVAHVSAAGVQIHQDNWDMKWFLVCFPQLLRVNLNIKRLWTNGTNDIEPNQMKSCHFST